MKVQTIIAICVAILFHVSGAIGILLSPYKSWFVALTPLNLLLMFALLLINQQKINTSFILFLFIAFGTGLITEIVGVNTSLLFGHYEYGNVLGLKLKGVPLLIGINWFIIVYCCCSITHHFHEWIETKATSSGMKISTKTKTLSFIADVGLMAVCFDFLIEPVAIKLGFWNWQNHIVPLYNYVCWFVIAALIGLLFKQFKSIQHNYFALHLFIIQILFFAALRIYL